MSDFVVIGGGIAGVSAAAYLVGHGSVTLLEMEETLAYHTTGRSAALFVVHYGGHAAGPLAKASKSFFDNPPEGSTEAPLLSNRGVLWIGQESHLDELGEIAREGNQARDGSRMVTATEAVELVPTLREDTISGGLYVPSAHDIDVAGLHQAFIRIARRAGAEILTSTPVTRIERDGAGWSVMSGGVEYPCSAVINASGAWGDHIADLAGVEPVGLIPMRRTAFMVGGSPEYSNWPMVVDAEERFYFKPDGVQILCSLAEENPAEPGDPRPRMEDVALAIERINEATTLGIRSVNSQWTGLRTFAPDRAMVIGEEPTAPGFYWLTGQGGTGIQTSPAYGALLASIVTGSELPEELAEAGIDPGLTSPARFRT